MPSDSQSPVDFTSTLTVEPLMCYIDGSLGDDMSAVLDMPVTISVTAPAFSWVAHRAVGDWNIVPEETRGVTFYVPDSTRRITEDGTEASLFQQNLVRGALEINAEHAFETFTNLMKNGISAEIAQTVLPSTFMLTCIVQGTVETVLSFISWSASGDEGVSDEMATLGRGYQHMIEDFSPKYWARLKESGFFPKDPAGLTDSDKATQ